MTQPALSVQLYAVNDQLTRTSTAPSPGWPAWVCAMSKRSSSSRAPRARGGVRPARTRREDRARHAPVRRAASRRRRDAGARRSRTSSRRPRPWDSTSSSTPSSPLERWLDEDQVAATAARLNQAAERAADYGLRVGYHNHSQEFAASLGGRSAYEVFADQLRDDVALEVDLYWAATAKQDVPALLGRLGDRVKALHMKDGVIGADPFGLDAAPFDPTSLDQRPAGQGELPLLDYLARSPEHRVRGDRVRPLCGRHVRGHRGQRRLPERARGQVMAALRTRRCRLHRHRDDQRHLPREPHQLPRRQGRHPGRPGPAAGPAQAEKYGVPEWGSSRRRADPSRGRDRRQPDHPRRPCPGRRAGDRRRQARLDGEADQHRPGERARPAGAGRRGRPARRRRARHGARSGRPDRAAGDRARRHRRAPVGADGDAVRRARTSSTPTRSSSSPRAPGRCSTWARTT